MVKVNAQKSWLPVLLCLLILPLIMISGCVSQEDTSLTTQVIEDVTTGEAYALIQDNQGNPNFAIIDVRTPEEYATGHIENAMILDYYEDNFKDELDKLDKDKTYLIYCRSGTRSGKSLDIMRELGFGEVYNMLGGMIQWGSDGLPTVQ